MTPAKTSGYQTGHAHIGKEANHLDRRASGEVDADEAADLLLTYTDPANDPWRTRDLPRLRLIPSARVAAATGISERRLQDIYAGISTPHPKNRILIRAQLAEEVAPT